VTTATEADDFRQNPYPLLCLVVALVVQNRLITNDESKNGREKGGSKIVVTGCLDVSVLCPSPCPPTHSTIKTTTTTNKTISVNK